MLFLGFDVRELTASDLPAMHSIVQARRKIGKHSLNEEEVARLVEDLSAGMDNPLVRYVGAFKEEVLWCFMTIQTTPNGKKSFLMSFLATNPDVVSEWHYRRSGLDSLWAWVWMWAMKENRFFCYWSLPTKWVATQERTRRTSFVWKMYDIEAYAEVPAGTIPEDPFDHWVFGRDPKSYDVTLKRAYLKLAPKRELLQRTQATSAPQAT